MEYTSAKLYADAKGFTLIEASAKYGINVEKIFYNIVIDILKSGSVELHEKITRTDSSVVLEEGTEIKNSNSCCRLT